MLPKLRWRARFDLPLKATYAAATCAETVYLAYPYCVVPPRHFALATCAVRAAGHLGNALGSLVGQVAVSPAFGAELRLLFYLSAARTTTGCLCFALLPPPAKPGGGPSGGTSGGGFGLGGVDPGEAEADGPVSFAGAWLRDGPTAVAREVAALYRHAYQAGAPALPVWSLWWVLGTSAAQVAQLIALPG